jgi:hypothetical protein
MPASTVLVAGEDALGGGAALLVRLHGPSSSVQADRRIFEEAIGRPLEALEGDEAVSALRIVRDHPGSGGEEPSSHAAPATGIGVASALPARLGNVLSALDSALGDVPFSADVFAGTARFAFGPDQLSGVATVRRALEVLGGSLGLERAPAGAGPDLGGMVTVAPSGERALAERVRAVFDPPGVFWRAGEAVACVEPTPSVTGGRR